MKFNIKKYNEPKMTFKVKSIIGKFDLQDTKFTEEFIGNIELPNEWKIGMIVGTSGSGKSTIAKELFKDFLFTEFDWTDAAVIDDIEEPNVDKIVKMFNSVGFSSPISWLKPYKVLSNGEKMRVDLARALLNDDEMIVFDEYTSVVDRNVAKIGSLALQKSVRKSEKKKFIAVGCHFDVEEWLQPDWVFNTNTMEYYEPKKKSQNLDMNYGKIWISQYGRCLVNTTI